MDELERRLTDALHAEADAVTPHGTAWNGRPPPVRRGWPTWLAIAAAVAAVMMGATFAVTRHGGTPETANPPIQGTTSAASPTGAAARYPCDGGWTAPGTAVITGMTQSSAAGIKAILRFAGDPRGPATLCALISSVDGTTLASGSAAKGSSKPGYLTMITGQQTYFVGAFSGGTTVTVSPGEAPPSRAESGEVTVTASTTGVIDLGNGWHGYAVLAPETRSSAVRVTETSVDGTVLGRRDFTVPTASPTSPPASSATASTPPPTSGAASSSSVSARPGRVLDAQQPAWAEKGRELIAEQKAHPPVGVANSKRFAYQSDHFDLIKDGMYDVVFHVPASFSLTPPADGRAISLGFAMPDDRQCRLQPGGVPSLVKTSAGYDLHYPLYASRVSFAYPGFSIWLY